MRHRGVRRPWSPGSPSTVPRRALLRADRVRADRARTAGSRARTTTVPVSHTLRRRFHRLKGHAAGVGAGCAFAGDRVAVSLQGAINAADAQRVVVAMVAIAVVVAVSVVAVSVPIAVAVAATAVVAITADVECCCTKERFRPTTATKSPQERWAPSGMRMDVRPSRSCARHRVPSQLRRSVRCGTARRPGHTAGARCRAALTRRRK